MDRVTTILGHLNAAKGTSSFLPNACRSEEDILGDLIIVSSYTQFDNLAHGPTGTEAKNSMWSYRLNPHDGQLTQVSVTEGDNDAMNPAFSRMHPNRRLLYACTESVNDNGVIAAWNIDRTTGKLTKQASTDAKGTSTCYITLDKAARNMFIVNYWDASIHVFGLDYAGGIASHRSKFDPNQGREMVASGNKHVNHSMNDASAQEERQADPHSHAIVLDPVFDKIAYVPDLGKDLIRQFYFDSDTGTLTFLGHFPSGPPGARALGPRYIHFHPTLSMCYVVNELSSEVAVFEFDKATAEAVIQGGRSHKPTLRLVQTVSTVPAAWPKTKNTCGRIVVHKAGDFVLCSNRGHDSVASYRVMRDSSPPGMIELVCIQHVHGLCPRHFTFDNSGQWFITANQDSDEIRVFRFNMAMGTFISTGISYKVPSPNFVCTV